MRFPIPPLLIIMNKSLLIRSMLVGSILRSILFVALLPTIVYATPEAPSSKFCKENSYIAVVKTVKMVVTAYSSTEDQTDDTPFITASGKHVEDGIIANNMLSFGTKVRIPELYGDKIFIVQDRMHKRKGKYHADVWMPEYKQAKEFGAKWNVKVEILES